MEGDQTVTPLAELFAALKDDPDERKPLTIAERVYLYEGLQAAIDNCLKAHDEQTAEVMTRIRAKLMHQHPPL